MLGLYLIAINIVTFAAFAWDKRAAKRRAWRAPENQLLALAAVGGTLGALLAQRLLRHKTHKQPFAARLWSIAAAQAGLGVAAYLLLLR